MLIEKLQELKQEVENHLLKGNTADWASYKHQVGQIWAYEKAIGTLKDMVKEYEEA